MFFETASRNLNRLFINVCWHTKMHTLFTVAFPQGFFLENSYVILSPGLELLYHKDSFKCDTDLKYWKSNSCEIIKKWQWRRKYFHCHASPLYYNNFIKNSYNIKYFVFTFYSCPFLWIFTCFLLQLYAYHISSVFLILLKLKDGSHKKNWRKKTKTMEP